MSLIGINSKPLFREFYFINENVALVGFKSSGKNTAAIPLIEQYGYVAS